MPRGKRRTTTSGEPAQPVNAFADSGYGQGVAQEALQQVAPAVDRRGVTSQPDTSPAAAASAPPLDLAAMLAAAPTGMLSGGTRRPTQPITSGLSTGPGPGREALGNLSARTPLKRTLLTLHQRTGDPLFRDLIDRAGL